MAKVLIVDDSDFLRLVLRRMLEKHGFEVIGEAADGQKGIEMCVALNPDIVTLDVNMPVMSGDEALKHITALMPKIKVVMVSALSQMWMQNLAKEEGAVAFIVKPYKEENIVSTLKDVAGGLA